MHLPARSFASPATLAIVTGLAVIVVFGGLVHYNLYRIDPHANRQQVLGTDGSSAWSRLGHLFSGGGVSSDSGSECMVAPRLCLRSSLNIGAHAASDPLSAVPADDTSGWPPGGRPPRHQCEASRSSAETDEAGQVRAWMDCMGEYLHGGRDLLHRDRRQLPISQHQSDDVESSLRRQYARELGVAVTDGERNDVHLGRRRQATLG